MRPSALRSVSIVWGFVVLAALCASTALAQDRVRVSVGDVDGGAGVRRAVTDALAGDARVEVVDSGAQMTISASARGRGRSRTFTFEARDASGSSLGTERARSDRASVLARAVTALLDDALPQISRGSASGSTSSATTSSSSGSGGGFTAFGDTEEEDDATDESSSGSGSSSSSSTGSSSGGDASASSFGAPVPIFTAAIGIGIRSRDTSVDVSGGMARTYHVSPFAELYARLELRPLGSDAGYGRGLFFWGDFGYALGLASRLPDTTRVDATFLRFSLHAGYLVPVDRFFEIGASVGFGYEHYDLGTNTVLPTIDYPYLRPAVRVRIRLVDEWLVLGLDAGYRALFSRDGLGGAFGAGGDSFGLDGMLSVSGATDFGLAWSVEGGWAQYFHSFSGAPGTLASGTHGADGGYRIYVALGYAFR